jgi:hypothetical protein
MKPVIKITDIESGKELEIVEKNYLSCSGCFYENMEDCPDGKYCEYCIFKEVTKEENGKKN